MVNSSSVKNKIPELLEDSSSQENFKGDEDLFEQVENKREDWVIDNISLMNNTTKEQPIQKWVCKDYWELCSIFSCFGLFQLSADHELMEINFRKKKWILFRIYPFKKTSLSFSTTVKVWKIQFNLYSLFFRVLKIVDIFLF